MPHGWHLLTEDVKRGLLQLREMQAQERAWSATSPRICVTTVDSHGVCNWIRHQQHCRRLRISRRQFQVAATRRFGDHNGNHLADIADFSAADEQQSEKLVALGVRPPRPRRIILVRHGQSEGNIDENAYTRIPDSRISLTTKGWEQAIECGQRIRKLAESDGAPDWKVYFYASPYKRSLQTLRGIGRAFERERIAGAREEPRLREQDFGNFQDRERMRVEKEIRLRYGRFFYRFPNGESAADVYDRITGFRETLRADIDIGRFQRPEDGSRNMNLIIISHGLTLRVFLMRWYKWTVEQFEGLWNFGNTGTLVMETGTGGRYSLLVHHTEEELKAFGMTDAMIRDQAWQMNAKPGELNYDWSTSGCGFFDHLSCSCDQEQVPDGGLGSDRLSFETNAIPPTTFLLSSGPLLSRVAPPGPRPVLPGTEFWEVLQQKEFSFRRF